MKYRFHQSALAYNGFDKLIGKVTKYLYSFSWRLGEFSNQEVVSRLIQRVATVSFYPYVKETLKSLRGNDTLLSTGTFIFDGLSISLDNGTIQITSKLVFRSFMEFFYVWGLLFLNITNGGFRKSKFTKAGTLIYGVPEEFLFQGKSNQRFKEFCETTAIAPITIDKRLIVQSSAQLNDNTIEYSKDPLGKLIQNTELGFFQRAKLLFLHLTQVFKYIFYVARNPLYAILDRDFASLAVVAELSKRNLIDSVVITNSNFANQLLWMRESSTRFGFKTHEIHYSQNTRPLLFKTDPIVSDFPQFRYVKVDEHWVWTEGYKDYVKSLGHNGKIHVAGSIMFQPRTVKKQSTGLCITVFDVTPIRDSRAESIGLINNYYNYKNINSFIAGIVTAVENTERLIDKRIVIHLKHKRGINPFHDDRYLKVCAELEKSTRIKLVPYDDNIYSLIGNSQLTISIPYTSTAYIACELGISSVFFDPTGEIKEDFEKMKGLQMVSSSKELEAIILQAMK